MVNGLRYIFAAFLLTISCLNAARVAVCCTATKKYIQFVDPFIKSCRKHLLKDHQVTYHIFTDNPDMVEKSDDIVAVKVEHRDWPYATLLRFQNYFDAHDLLQSYDYIFATDVDMLFVGDAGDEILGSLVGTLHPGFYNKPRNHFSYEQRPNSKAYIAPNEGKNYFAGALYGGNPQEFFKLLNFCLSNIKDDLSRNFIAVWHDESHLNRYFAYNRPTNILSPAYCYPESLNLPFQKIFLALDKNHTEIRN